MSSPSTIRIGLIGAGNMARAKCLTRMAEVQLVAVASRTTESARRLAGEYSIPEVFNHHCDLLASGVDAVMVATPNDTHYQIVKDALEAGKDVLVEYPMVLHSEQASVLVGLAEQRQAVVEVGFDTRFHPLDQKLREAVRAGQIGQPLWCSAELLYHLDYQPEKWYWQQESTRGMIASWMVERFDLLRRLCGEVDSVLALQAPDIYAGATVFQQQTCVVNLQFRSGAVGVVSLSCLAPFGFPASVVQAIGSEGGLWCDGQTLRLFTSAGEESILVETGWDPLAEETSHFVQCVCERTPAENPPAESLAALRVAEAALESLLSNRMSTT